MKPEVFWDRQAKQWDTPSGEPDKNEKQIISKTLSYLRPEDTLMEYGCASGTIAMALAGKAKTVHGIDISSKMIEIAEKRTRESDLTNLKFTHSDIFNEQYTPASFDVITAFSVLHLLNDPRDAVRRINQLLKPGGYFISLTPCMGEKAFPGLFVSSAIFILSKTGLLPRNIRFFTRDTLVTTVTALGFGISEIECFTKRPVTDYFIVAQKQS